MRRERAGSRSAPEVQLPFCTVRVSFIEGMRNRLQKREWPVTFDYADALLEPSFTRVESFPARWV